MRTLLATLLLAFAFIAPAYAGVDINNADAAELETLPGIGPSKAAAIVQYRTEHGAFTTVDELDNVPGIGASTLASLRDQVIIGKGGKAATPTTGSSSGSAPAASASAPKAPPASSPPSEGAASASSGGCPVNINTADATALEDLPGIGASKAAAILQHRVDNGPFASCDALDDVSGIGPSTLAGLRDCCRVK